MDRYWFPTMPETRFGEYDIPPLVELERTFGLTRYVNYVVIAANSPVIVALHHIDHGRHQRPGSPVEAPTVQNIPDKQAGIIHRQSGYICIELLPVLIILEQILFDI